MKVLFAIPHALYLRNFDSVIRRLGADGHAVEVCFTAARLEDAQTFRELFAGHASVALTDAPLRRGWWWPAADPLRALRDFLHYQNPHYRKAVKARQRTARRVPSGLRSLIERTARSPRLRAWIDLFLGRLEWSIPVDAGLRDWLHGRAPDVVVVSPLIDLDYYQLDLLKAAKSLAMRTIHIVASWDNLTNKGRIQIAADRITVWNEAQRAEARILHEIDDRRVIATGAQLYDRWFAMKPELSRRDFCEIVGGLDADKPILLYVGSSPFICPDETLFFRKWLARIRADQDPLLASAGVLVRPHPLHARQWRGLADAQLRVWPPDGEMPIGETQRRNYFESLWHADAVIGINTSVFLETAIVGRKAFTVLDDMFAETQEGMIHFAHVVKGGPVSMATSLGRHMDALREELHRPRNQTATDNDFLRRFLRPRGVGVEATAALVEVVEHPAPVDRAFDGSRLVSIILVMMLWPLAALYLRPSYLAALRRRGDVPR